MWVGIVGSRTFGTCTCKPEATVHPEDCPMLADWLLTMSVVTRLAKQVDLEGIVSGGANGADTMAKDAAVMLGVKVLEIKPAGGREPFWERAKRRNQRIVDKVAKSGGWIVALFGPGPRSPGTSDTLERAKAAKLKTFVHHEGRWLTE